MMRNTKNLTHALAALLFALLAILRSEPLEAAENRWSLVGPEGEVIVSSLTVDPQRSGAAYVGTYGAGVFRTSDWGTSWQPTSEGLLGPWVDQIQVDPHRDGVLYATTSQGVFRSVDRADSWQPWETPKDFQRILIASDDGDRLWGVFINEVWASVDGGSSWRQLTHPVRPQQNHIDSIVVTPGPNRSFLVSVEGDFGGTYRSQDGGISWTQALPFPVKTLAPHPGQPETVYAASYLDGALLRTLDGGTTWTEISTLDLICQLAVDPSNDDTLYAATRDLGIFKSADSGITWTAINNGLVDFGFPNALVPDPTTPGTIWTGSGSLIFGGGGVHLSTDGGDNWTQRQAGIFTNPLRAAAVNGRGRVYAGGDAGVWTRDDEGAWTLRLERFGIQDVEVHPTNPKIALATGVYLFNGSTEILFRTTDEGQTWAAIGDFGFTDGFALAFAPSDPEIVFFGAKDASTTQTAPGVYVSSNGGDSWNATGLTRDISALAVDPVDPDTVLAVSFSRVHRTDDGGRNWEIALEARSSFASVVFSPSDPRIAYATGNRSGTYRSQDGGQTWSPVNGDFEDLAVDPTNSDWLYGVGSSSRSSFSRTSLGVVHRSLDGGQTWFALNPGLNVAQVKDLAFDPQRPERLWAATFGAGMLTGDFPTPEALSTQGGRFAVRVSWRDGRGRIGRGVPVAVTDETGYHWFFNPENVELFTKVLDGRAINGHHWVFYGAMSNVGYQMTVSDTLTGEHVTYDNASGAFGSLGDTSAFPEMALGEPASTVQPASASSTSLLPSSTQKADCAAGSDALCLLDERFRVEVDWQDYQGNTGAGRAVPLTPDTGTFWFFSPNNLELAVKILDGRAFNDRVWVFYGALSDVRYTLKITDTETGAVKLYENPLGHQASVGDIEAF